MNTPILFWTCGLPGSGKSTFAKRLADNQGVLVVSRDQIRTRFQKSNSYSPHKEKYVVRLIEDEVKAALLDGQDVLVDNVNVEISQRAVISNWVKDLWSETDGQIQVVKICLYFECTIDASLIRRKEKIAKKPGLEEGIRRFSKNLVVPDRRECFHVFWVDALDTPTESVMHRHIFPFKDIVHSPLARTALIEDSQ